jgi:hypothetical protein
VDFEDFEENLRGKVQFSLFLLRTSGRATAAATNTGKIYSIHPSSL